MRMEITFTSKWTLIYTEHNPNPKVWLLTAYIDLIQSAGKT